MADENTPGKIPLDDLQKIGAQPAPATQPEPLVQAPVQAAEPVKEVTPAQEIAPVQITELAKEVTPPAKESTPENTAMKLAQTLNIAGKLVGFKSKFHSKKPLTIGGVVVFLVIAGVGGYMYMSKGKPVTPESTNPPSISIGGDSADTHSSDEATTDTESGSLVGEDVVDDGTDTGSGTEVTDTGMGTDLDTGSGTEVTEEPPSLDFGDTDDTQPQPIKRVKGTSNTYGVAEKSRDTQRIADIEKMAGVLTNLSISGELPETACTDEIGLEAPDFGGRIPADPSSSGYTDDIIDCSGSYYYKHFDEGSDYAFAIYGKLETPIGNIPCDMVGEEIKEGDLTYDAGGYQAYRMEEYCYAVLIQ